MSKWKLSACACASVQRMNGFITRCVSHLPLHQLSALADYKSNQSTSKNSSCYCCIKPAYAKGQKLSEIYHFYFCFQTYRSMSPVSLPKVSTDPLRSLLLKRLCAKCVGSIVWKGCFASSKLFWCHAQSCGRSKQENATHRYCSCFRLPRASTFPLNWLPSMYLRSVAS